MNTTLIRSRRLLPIVGSVLLGLGALVTHEVVR